MNDYGLINKLCAVGSDLLYIQLGKTAPTNVYRTCALCSVHNLIIDRNTQKVLDLLSD